MTSNLKDRLLGSFKKAPEFVPEEGVFPYMNDAREFEFKFKQRIGRSSVYPPTFIFNVADEVIRKAESNKLTEREERFLNGPQMDALVSFGILIYDSGDEEFAFEVAVIAREIAKETHGKRIDVFIQDDKEELGKHDNPPRRVIGMTYKFSRLE